MNAKGTLAHLLLILWAPLSAIDPTIPVLDLHDYHNPATRQEFISEFSTACQEVGFCALVNAGVNQIALEDAYRAMEAFFALDEPAKMKCYLPNSSGQRGYLPGESPKGSSDYDFKEFYHIGYCGTENVWPEEIDLQSPTLALFDDLRRSMGPLEEALSLAMGQSAGYISKLTQDGDTIIRLCHYPANPPPEDEWGRDHTDISLFTVLPRPTASGLQFCNKQGEWITVIVPRDAVIFRVGDKLQNLTNGLFRSSVCRIRSLKSDTDRYAAPLYVHPTLSADLSPLPACISLTGGIQHYPDATSQELLEERLAELRLISPDMLAHLARSGFIERTIDLGRPSPEAIQALADAGLANSTILRQLTTVHVG